MYYPKKLMLLAFTVTALTGVGLHFLYHALPFPATALFAPVSESLWEHVKLLFWPGLAAALLLSRGRPGGIRPWLLALVVACVGMLAVAYVMHVVLGLDSLVADILLYFFMMALLFFIATRLPGPYEGPLWMIPVVLAILLGVCIFLFTLMPPAGPLFSDPEAIRTWATLPV